MAGMTTSPQLRESPDTAKYQGLEEGRVWSDWRAFDLVGRGAVWAETMSREDQTKAR
jgi:hypothetical protein